MFALVLSCCCCYVIIVAVGMRHAMHFGHTIKINVEFKQFMKSIKPRNEQRMKTHKNVYLQMGKKGNEILKKKSQRTQNLCVGPAADVVCLKLILASFSSQH